MTSTQRLYSGACDPGDANGHWRIQRTRGLRRGHVGGLTASALARKLGVHENMIHELARAGVLKFTRDDDHIRRFDQAEAERDFRAHREAKKAKRT